MQIVLLDALTFEGTDLSAFDALGDVEVFATTAPEQTQQRITNAEVIVTNKVVITKEFMLGAKNLKLICIAATGMNNVDLDAAKELNIEVFYYSTSGVNRTEDFQRTTLDDMLSTCDIITIHAPLNDKTNNLLDYEQLLTCKEGATILNLGRGGIINEDAVARTIDEKNISFGLDVLTKEPMRENHALLSVKNKERLYITPHIAWTSIEAREKLIAGVVQNIKATL